MDYGPLVERLRQLDGTHLLPEEGDAIPVSDIIVAIAALTRDLEEASEVRDVMIAWAVEFLATDPNCGSYAEARTAVTEIIRKNRPELRRIRAEKANSLSRTDASMRPGNTRVDPGSEAPAKINPEAGEKPV